jgi:uncharacterized membrane protein
MRTAAILALVLGAVTLSACGEESGVCTACCGSAGQTYCKDGWTESECDDWSAQQVNGLTWHFYGGQTCAERGTPATP